MGGLCFVRCHWRAVRFARGSLRRIMLVLVIGLLRRRAVGLCFLRGFVLAGVRHVIGLLRQVEVFARQVSVVVLRCLKVVQPF